MKTFFSKMLLAIGFLLVFDSCRNSISSDDNQKILMETDVAFSNYCLQNGMNKAFYKYAAEKAVMLKDNRFPLIGNENIKKEFSGDDTQVTFSWSPLDADVSESGELGYTYGTYAYQTIDSLYEGTYVSVWKKDGNGDWKYVLDSGNQGLGK
jgi:ketosteroid isomerase-like protein